ncbi:MAG: amidohydrolase family protein, partial [Bacteroidales bacterium]|nr:amidohydrolase family protein [Bacteroidales bacterium]
AEVPLLDAVKMITLTPAKIMKIDNKKGSIRRGKDADLVIFDKSIKVSHTIIGGKVVFTS